MQVVIPGLTRNPGFFWIPAFAGMTRSVVIDDARYRSPYSNRHQTTDVGKGQMLNDKSVMINSRKHGRKQKPERSR
jgi:hypothetical protein